jgi:hypothetical protein
MEPDYNDATLLPLMEMSQDCIIEWNESKNVDLREIAKSPRFATPASTTRGTTVGLEDIRRQLEQNEDTDTSPASLHTQPPLSARKVSAAEAAAASNNDNNNKEAEEEIDAIFSILQQEDDGCRSPSTAPTQRLSNRTAFRAKPLRSVTTTTSLASRHRRRRREGKQSTGSNKRQQLKKSSSNECSSPMPSISERDDGEGAFESLLAQMSTPQSVERSRPPLSTMDNNALESTNDDEPQQAPKPNLQMQQTTAANTAEAARVTPAMPTTKKQPLNPNTRQSLPQPRTLSQDRRQVVPPQPGNIASFNQTGQLQRIVPSKPIQGIQKPPPSRATPPFQPQQVPTRTAVHSAPPKARAPSPNRQTRPNEKKTMLPPPVSSDTPKPVVLPNNNDDDDEFGDIDFGDIDLDALLSIKSSQQALPPQPMNVNRPRHQPPARAPQQAYASVNANPLHQPPVRSPQQALTPVNRLPQKPHAAVNANSPHQPPVRSPQQAQAPVNRPPQKPHASVNANSPHQPPVLPPQQAQTPVNGSQQAQQPRVPLNPSRPPQPSISKQKPEPPLVAAQQQQQQQPVSPIKPLGKQESPEDDEFGDFPDFDFDLMDQAIAQRDTEKVMQAPSALQNEIVRNPKIVAIETTGLAFIKFSRYKILNVAEDNQKWTKNLVVAAWTESMLRDEEEEKKIHRNCKVEDLSASETPPVTIENSSPRRNINYPESGSLQLRGEWYHTKVSPGDVIHLCSLTGRYRTDAAALPIVLHSMPPQGSDVDDLVLIIHPDMLMTPTTVSETVSCSRRAVLKSRIGSTGLTSKAALFGTMRHELFGLVMKENNFDPAYVKRNVQKIVRQSAEALLGCGVATAEAEREVMNVLPVIKNFVAEYTTFGKGASATPRNVVQGHCVSQTDIRFLANAVHSIEEPIISPELALKGNIDAVLETTSGLVRNENSRSNHSSTEHSFMSLELKTGHNQTAQNAHMAQLSLYTLMLQVRYGTQPKQPSRNLFSSRSDKPDPDGASTGGILLYLNQKSFHSVHVAPMFNEIKSLIGQRNIVATELLRASRPRGISLSYEDESCEDDKGKRIKLLPAPPADLPEVKSTSHSCTRCFANRECMLYAAAEKDDTSGGVGHTHKELLSKFTGQLEEDDLAYFRKWDRLIDLEADASNRNAASAWLVNSHQREKETGESISSLVYDGAVPSEGGSQVLIRFRRGADTLSQSKLESLSITKGSYVIISTDGTSFDDSQSEPNLEYENTQRRRKKFRHHMHVVRGSMQEISSDGLLVSSRREDLERIRDMTSRYQKLSEDDGSSRLMFRLDKDNSSVGIGTLRQNIINFFSSDHSRKEGEEMSQVAVAKQRRLPRLRDSVVRLQPPSFNTNDTASFFRGPGPRIPGCDLHTLSREFEDLNSDQQDAVHKVRKLNIPVANDSILLLTLFFAFKGDERQRLYFDTGTSRYG